MGESLSGLKKHLPNKSSKTKKKIYQSVNKLLLLQIKNRLRRIFMMYVTRALNVHI